jgi:hypothetical protein
MTNDDVAAIADDHAAGNTFINRRKAATPPAYGKK